MLNWRYIQWPLGFEVLIFSLCLRLLTVFFRCISFQLLIMITKYRLPYIFVWFTVRCYILGLLRRRRYLSVQESKEGELDRGLFIDSTVGICYAIV
jgi:hypothetical protein